MRDYLSYLHPFLPKLFADCPEIYRIEDIVIVMDGSGSIGTCEFDHGKKALHYMMRSANDGSIDAKYAAVTFATSATVNFKFLPYSLAAEKITQTPYPDGETNTQAGLKKAKKLFDDPSSGMCSNKIEKKMLK